MNNIYAQLFQDLEALVGSLHEEKVFIEHFKQVGAAWSVVLNLTGEDYIHLDYIVSPSHCHVRYNGWPVGDIGNGSMMFSAKEPCTFGLFLQALRAELELRGKTTVTKGAT